VLMNEIVRLPEARQDSRQDMQRAQTPVERREVSQVEKEEKWKHTALEV
jgi:hypothetical protein